MLIPPDTNNTPPLLSPGGDGYASITNSGATTKITGALADGTAFNQSVPISSTGYLPVYANLYGGKGLLLGWINLDSTNASGVSLTWIHPRATHSGLYTNGFTNVLFTNQILLSAWTNTSANIELLTNLTLLPEIDDTNGTGFAIATAANGQISDPANSIKGSINLKTGTYKVSIGTGSHATNSFGAILLNSSNDGGYFLAKTNAQAVELQP